MEFVKRYNTNENNKDIRHFFYLLERLAAFFLISGYNVNTRIRCYAEILTRLENKSLKETFSFMELTSNDKDEIKKGAVIDN